MVVPGSHKWVEGRQAEAHEVVQAVMPAGSTVYWAGGVLHAAAANITDDCWRESVFVSYELGWLRTEENQYLDVPLQVAEALDPKLKALVGYDLFSHGSLGFYDPRLLGSSAPATANKAKRARL